MELIIDNHLVIFDDDIDPKMIDGIRVSESQKGRFYVRNKNGIRIHRIIMGVKSAKISIDHINGNPLDNRKENLRKCVQSQNTKNRSKIKRKTTSKYKGVYLSRGKWVAMIRSDYKRYYLGAFSDEKEAAEKYNQAAIKYHKKFAKLNEFE